MLGWIAECLAVTIDDVNENPKLLQVSTFEFDKGLINANRWRWKKHHNNPNLNGPPLLYYIISPLEAEWFDINIQVIASSKDEEGNDNHRDFKINQ